MAILFLLIHAAVIVLQVSPALIFQIAAPEAESCGKRVEPNRNIIPQKPVYQYLSMYIFLHFIGYRYWLP
jgi:hypothetical protein